MVDGNEYGNESASIVYVDLFDKDEFSPVFSTADCNYTQYSQYVDFFDKNEFSPVVAVYRIRRCISHTPLGRLSKPDCSTTKRGAIPNDTSSESSRRDISNADIFGTVTAPTVEIPSMENQSSGVIV